MWVCLSLCVRFPVSVWLHSYVWGLSLFLALCLSPVVFLLTYAGLCHLYNFSVSFLLICLCVYCLFVRLFSHLFVCVLLVSVSVSILIWLSVRLLICVFLFLPVFLSYVRLCVFQSSGCLCGCVIFSVIWSVCLFVWLSLCLSAHVSLCRWLYVCLAFVIVWFVCCLSLCAVSFECTASIDLLKVIYCWLVNDECHSAFCMHPSVPSEGR